MNAPTMIEPRRVAPDTDMLSVYLPVPGLGILPANAFLIRAAEPVLVDTGVLALGEAFFDQVCSLIDPGDLRWIWLTHLDPDHLGCFDRLLEAAPQARIVTTFLGMGKLGLSRAIAPERIYLLNPGQALEVGDRRLLALKPPSFDAPETTGLFDARTRTLFSSDCFGALLGAPVESAADIAAADLRDGLIAWTSVDCPWLAMTDEAALRAAIAQLLAHEPAMILGSHLPPAPAMAETLAGYLTAARLAEPFVGPDQQALMAMMTGT
jgi:glyoxylase-like metal-dependent hydrolase (beta-lactamase superfamily II)